MQQYFPRPARHSVLLAYLLLIIGLISSPFQQVFFAPTPAFAATPAPGVLTPLVTPTYPVQIVSSRTGVGGTVCIGCSVTGTANVINSDITTPSDKANIQVVAGLNGSGTIAVQDTTNTYDAGYFAGYVISTPGVVNAQLLDSVVIRTYNNGTLQEVQPASTLLNISLFSGSDQKLVGFVTTKPFDEIDIRVVGLLSVASNVDVFYAAVQSVPPAPSITAPTAGSTTNGTPTITGTTIANATIAVKEGATTICTTTANASGAWSCTSAALASGAHSITATATNFVGSSAASTAVAFTVDATAPAVPVINAPAAGALVNSTTPTLSGTAEANSTVRVRENSTTLCTTTADGSGAWSCALGTPLSQGSHTIVATATDAVGNVSAASAGRTFTVDSIAPAAPTVSSPANGGVINTATPTIAGTAEASTQVTVAEGGTTVCTTTANTSGAWSCTPGTALGSGTHTLSVTATDAAGNTSAATTSSFTIDTAAVSTPSILAPASGASVNTTTPTISGTADANTTVTVSENATTICTATVTNGTWSCTLSTPLSEGTHTIVAVATNAANTTSGPATRTFIVDTIAPTSAPVISSPTSNSALNTNTPTFAGTAEANSTVTVNEGNTTICVAVTDGSGAWSCAPSAALSDGPHSVTAVASDAAGNASPVSTALAFTVDTAAPTAPVITSPTAGATIATSQPAISGTAEQGSSVTVSDGSTVICIVTADNAGAWSCTPATALSEGSHTFTAVATDAAGNASPASAAVTITVDQTAPSAPTLTNPPAGTATNDTAPTISGSAEADSSVAVKEGSTIICTATADANGAWSCTPATALSEGSHAFVATATDAAGNVSANSAALLVTVDTTAPDAPVISSPAPGGTISNTTPTIAGTAEASSQITVIEGATPVCTATTDANGAWSCTASTAFGQGSHTLSVTATDAAGNTSTPTTTTFTINSAAVSTPSIVAPAAGSFTNQTTLAISGTADVGATVTVTENGAQICTAVTDANGNWSCANVAFAEGAHTISAVATNAANTASSAATLTFTVDTSAPASAPTITNPAENAYVNTTVPTFDGTGAEPNSTVTVTDGNTVVCVTQADGSGAWSCSSTALNNGVHSVTATSTDAAGNASPSSSPRTFTIDTEAPAAAVIVTPSAGATIQASPTITGTAEVGSNLVVTVDGTQECTVTVPASGAWSCTPSPALGEGPHTVTVAITDAAGNTGPVALAPFSIDSTAPAAPSITSPAAGSAINGSNPLIAGTAEAGSTVSVTENGTPVCTTMAGANGDWSCAPNPALGDGQHTVTATATDGAGNISPASAPRTFTVDTIAPTIATTFTSPAEGAITNSTNPTIAGTAEPNSSVAVSEGTAPICSATADGNGNWSCIAALPLSEGTHILTAKATDAAGNSGQDSDPRQFTIDTIAPNAPTISSPAAGGSINNTTPQIVGTAEPNSTVTVSEGATTVCTAAVNAQGNWNCTPSTPLSSGGHTLTVTATDAAGNTGAAATQTFTIDTSVVSTPSILTPAVNASTNDTTPTISGTADANVTVAVTENNAAVCTATADATGAWSCTPASPLSEGTHTISAVATNATNTASTPATRTFTIDTIAPTSAPSITTPSQGSVLNTQLPVFSGNNAEADSTVTVRENNAQICATLASSTGAWSCTPSTALNDGSHTVTATATDAAGNTGPASTGRTFSVDTTAPAAPVVTSPAAGSTTNDTMPTFTGTTEPGSTVTVKEGTTTICTATADANGNWSCTASTPLNSGDHTVTVTTTDPAGNTSDPTSRTFTVDPTAVSTPTIITPADADYTNDSTPLVSGTADPGTTVQVSEGTMPICSATTAADGTWSCTPVNEWSEGTHTITAVATSPLGRMSSPATRMFMVDTVAPEAPVITGPVHLSTTNDTTPDFTGTAEANSIVTVIHTKTPPTRRALASDDVVGETICTTTSDANGNWRCTPSDELDEGAHETIATATDPASNTSLPSNTTAFTVSTTLASITITSPAKGSFISDRTPTVSGTALPNSTVTLVVDPDNTSATANNVTFQTQVDANGNWAIDLGSARPTSGALAANGLDLGAMVSLTATNRSPATSSEASVSLIVQIGMRLSLPIVYHR